MMMAYPTETQKGKFIGIFWSIFNLGGVVGASVAAGRNWKSTVGARVFVTHDYVFIRVYRPTLLIMGRTCVSVFNHPTFCLLINHPQIESIVLHLFVFSLLANSNKMICSDGTKVTTRRHPSWKTDITGLFVTLKTDSMLLFQSHLFLLPTGSTHGVNPPPFSGSSRRFNSIHN